MSTTYVFVTKSAEKADAKAGAWKTSGEQVRIIPIGPTDRVEITGEAGPKVQWESGKDADWHLVIATRDAPK